MADQAVLGDDVILKKALLAAALFALASGLALLMYWLQVPQPEGPGSLQLRPTTIEEKADVLRSVSESGSRTSANGDEKLKILESLSQTQPIDDVREATTTVPAMPRLDTQASGGMSEEEKLKILSGLKAR
jgi:hypothetical protein